MQETYEKSIFEEDQIHVAYASFWERFGALFLDGLILLPLTAINLYNHTGWKSMTILILVSLASIIYKPLFEYLQGATPGKKGLTIAVTSLSFEKPNLQEAILRNIFGIAGGLLGLIFSIRVFSSPQFADVNTMTSYNQLNNEVGLSVIYGVSIGAVYIIDVIFFFVNKNNQSLHDMIGKTLVVKK